MARPKKHPDDVKHHVSIRLSRNQRSKLSIHGGNIQNNIDYLIEWAYENYCLIVDTDKRKAEKVKKIHATKLKKGLYLYLGARIEYQEPHVWKIIDVSLDVKQKNFKTLSKAKEYLDKLDAVIKGNLSYLAIGV